MSGGQMQSGVTLRNDLRELVEEITFEELNLQADVILPGINVVEVAAHYPVLPRESRMKVPDTSRAPNGSFARGQWEFGQGTYTCEEYGFEEPVDVTQALENSNFINEEEMAAQLSVEGLMLARESRVATAVFNTTAFAGTGDQSALAGSSYFTAATDCLLTVTNEMDDATNAAPRMVIDGAWKVLRAKNGLAKDQYSLIISDDLVTYMLYCDEVVDSIMYTMNIQSMSQQQKLGFLAEYLGIKSVVPISSIYDTTGLTNAATIGKFWSNEFALLAKLSTGTQSFKERCVGRQTVWTKYSPNYIIEDYPEPQKNSRIYRAREYRGIIINTDYGVLLQNMKTTVNATSGM